MLDLQVIDKPAVASSILDPVRAAMLAALRTPGSATTVAETLGQSRQKVNYHLRALEDHGLVELVELRPRRGLTERIMVASAQSYVLSPALLGEVDTDPAGIDRLSSQYLIAMAARTVREVASLTEAANAAGKRLATLSLDAEVCFANAAARAAFSEELAAAMTNLVAKYHDEQTPGGRWHRLSVGAHPVPPGGDPDSHGAPSRAASPTDSTTDR